MDYKKMLVSNRNLMLILLYPLFFVPALGTQKEVDSLKVDSDLSDSVLYRRFEYKAKVSKKPEEKLFYAKSALLVGHKTGNDTWKARAKLHEGDAYLLKGELNSAIQAYFEGIEIYRAINHIHGMGIASSKLGIISLRKNEVGKAKSYFKEAAQYFEELKDTVLLASLLLNLGEVCRENNEYEVALDNFYKSERYFIEKKFNSGYAYARGNIGLVYLAQNKLDSAEHLLNTSIGILEPLNDNYAVSYYLDGLAEVYFKRGYYDKAKTMAHKSLALAREHGLKEQIRDACLRLTTVYGAMESYQKADNYYKQYIIYRDSINNEESNFVFNTDAKNEESQMLKANATTSLLKDEYFMISASFVFIILLLIVLTFIILIKK